jgi:hypothetical protein
LDGAASGHLKFGLFFSTIPLNPIGIHPHPSIHPVERHVLGIVLLTVATARRFINSAYSSTILPALVQWWTLAKLLIM